MFLCCFQILLDLENGAYYLFVGNIMLFGAVEKFICTNFAQALASVLLWRSSLSDLIAQRPEDGVAARVDGTCAQGFVQGAVGFCVVAAVAKAALS